MPEHALTTDSSALDPAQLATESFADESLVTLPSAGDLTTSSSHSFVCDPSSSGLSTAKGLLAHDLDETSPTTSNVLATLPHDKEENDSLLPDSSRATSAEVVDECAPQLHISTPLPMSMLHNHASTTPDISRTSTPGGSELPNGQIYLATSRLENQPSPECGLRSPQQIHSSISLKRLAEDSEFDSFVGSQKRPHNQFATPKLIRPSAMSQKASQKKLAQPFRSPLFQNPAQSSNREGSAYKPTELKYNDSILTESPVSTPSRLAAPFKPQEKTAYRIRSRNRKSVSQPFKSPLKSQLMTSDCSTTRSNSSPNIQALERRLQLLRRAVKIRTDNEEETLLELTKKWRNVGRDVAWEIWTKVREQGEIFGWDSEANETPWSGRKESSWGWDDKAEETPELESCGPHKKCNSNRGADASEVDEQASSHDVQDETDSEGRDEQTQKTLGSMLRQLGVPNEIFGWNDGDEDFVDT